MQDELTPEEMYRIFSDTKIIRQPRYGIVSGYHELPYVCLGTSFDPEGGTLEARGTVHVSPRFVIRPQHYNPNYGEIFGEDLVDQSLTGRMFGYLGFRGRPVECKSEGLTVKHVPHNVDRVLSETLDDLERYEDITTGVLITPESRYFPVSVERFIASILEDEFSV